MIGFKKENKFKGESKMADGEKINTIVGKGSVLEGNFKIENSIRVDGVVKGDLYASDTVVVGKEGFLEASIKAKNVVVGGKVTGSIEASNKITLEVGSTVLGDIKTKLLVIEEGAVFKGKCDSGGSLEEVPPEKKVQPQVQAKAKP